MVESIGIKKTFEKIEQAQVVIYLVDGSQLSDSAKMSQFKTEIEKIKNQFPLKPLIILVNKADKLDKEQKEVIINAHTEDILLISAKENMGVEELKEKLLSFVNTGALRNNETIITNTRHYDSLLKALEEIQKVQFGLRSGLSADLMAIDIRQALYYFGEITGQVTNDELLGNIFANFCIGK